MWSADRIKERRLRGIPHGYFFSAHRRAIFSIATAKKSAFSLYKSRLAQVDRFRTCGTRSTMNDFLETAFCGLKLLLAMGFQRLPALVERDGVFEINLALLEARNDLFELLKRKFETQLVNRN